MLATNRCWGMDTITILGWGGRLGSVDGDGRSVWATSLHVMGGHRWPSIRWMQPAPIGYQIDRSLPTCSSVQTTDRSVFVAARFVDEVKRHCITLTKTLYRSPEGNTVVERFFRSLKEECAWQHTFNSLFEAEEAIVEWTRHYTEEWPHLASNEAWASSKKIAPSARISSGDFRGR